MSGTVSGGKKAAQKNIKLHGKNFYREIGRKGGKRSTTGGFASQKVGKDGLTGAERAKIAGAKGGRISKRMSASIKELRERITGDSKLATVLQDYLPQKKDNNKIIKKRFSKILVKACEYESTKSITTAVEVTEDLVEFAHDIVKVAELFGE